MQKQLFILLLSTMSMSVYSMESILKKIAGEQIIRYIPTEKREQERPLKILNHTEKSILLQATYACRTHVLYTAILCFGRCCTIQGFQATCECEDSPVLFDHGQTLELAPIQPKLATSKLRLASLKARFAHGPGDWVPLALPAQEQTTQSYQIQTFIDNNDATFTLMQQGNNLCLQ